MRSRLIWKWIVDSRWSNKNSSRERERKIPCYSNYLENNDDHTRADAWVNLSPSLIGRHVNAYKILWNYHYESIREVYSIWENIKQLGFFLTRVRRVYRHASVKTFYSQCKDTKSVRNAASLSIHFPIFLFLRFAVLSPAELRNEFIKILFRSFFSKFSQRSTLL